MPSLLLTKDEAALLEKLPSGVKKGWVVEPESTDAYESDLELQVRSKIAKFPDHPIIKKFGEQIEEGSDLTELCWDDIPEEVLGDFFFTIGARGMAIFIKTMIENAKTEQDLWTVERLASARHELLETNASISLAHS